MLCVLINAAFFAFIPITILVVGKVVIGGAKLALKKRFPPRDAFGRTLEERVLEKLRAQQSFTQ